MTVDEQGRTEPPLAAGELETLLGFLDYQRQTLEWKCRGVDEAGKNLTVGVSTMTLGGLVKHLGYVEDSWFGVWLHGRPPTPPWDTVDWRSDPDWEWRTAAADPLDALLEEWQAAVARSRTAVAEALAEAGGPESALGRPARKAWADGGVPTLRWILCHLIEEYARHNGHADLLREAVDGQVGE
jgi:uncharacterized damage-inducible protein DinB